MVGPQYFDERLRTMKYSGGTVYRLRDIKVTPYSEKYTEIFPDLKAGSSPLTGMPAFRHQIWQHSTKCHDRIRMERKNRLLWDRFSNRSRKNFKQFENDFQKTEFNYLPEADICQGHNLTLTSTPTANSSSDKKLRNPKNQMTVNHKGHLQKP